MKTAGNKSIANNRAGRWSNRRQIAISFSSGGRNSFEHQNKFLILGLNNELRLPGRRL